MMKTGKIKGRGTASRIDARYLSETRQDIDDGWATEAEDERPPTTVTVEHSKTIITRNHSPDIPFEASINPYRGCEHGCIYCLSGNTPILMADGSVKPLADVRAGDMVYGTVRKGWYRRYTKSRVIAHWSVIKPAYRITLADGTTLVAGGDHRFLTERGWKFVKGTGTGKGQRPYLTNNNKLMGIGVFAESVEKNIDYQSGYLCGVIRGDGLLASYYYQRIGRIHGHQHQFRLALCDKEALQRTQEYLQSCQIYTQELLFQKASDGRRALYGIRTHSRSNVERIRELISWPSTVSLEWAAGFLAGIFDAEGSYSQGILRITNVDEEIIAWIEQCLQLLQYQFSIEYIKREQKKSMKVVRLTGGLREHLRFFHRVDPAITRRRDFTGQAVKSNAKLGVVSIEPLGRAERLFDITTNTEDFIANGVVSHNCYARPAHAYMDLSPGIDFESKLFAKPDAPALLEKELAKPGYQCTPIALGSNTDPYQPIEREWMITRQIIEVLQRHDHPLTIVTKSRLVERDIDLLVAMAEKQLVQVFISITTLDISLAQRMEPRATSPQGRLAVLAKLYDAGIPTGVMFAPVIPALNDTEMEAVLAEAARTGVHNAGYVMLRLPHEIRQLFREWLETHYPQKAEHVMSLVRDIRGGRENDPRFKSRMRGEGVFADMIERRFRATCKRLGLNRQCITLDTGQFTPPVKQTDQLQLFQD